MPNEKKDPTFELKNIIGLIVRIEGREELITQIVNCEAGLNVFPKLPFSNNDKSMYLVLFDEKDKEKVEKIRDLFLSQGIKMTNIL